MALIKRSFNAGAKTITAAVVQTVVWTSGDIPGDKVVQYAVDLAVTGANSLANVTRLRVKAGSQTIWDIPTAHYRAWFQRMSRSNFSPLAADTRFDLPLYIPDAKGDERYDAGFPKGQAPTVEVVTSAAAVAGTATISYATREDKPLKFWHAYVSGQNNVAGANTNARFNITTGGLLRGFSINTVALTRLKLVLGGVEILNVSDQHLLNAEQAENINTLTDPLFFKLEEPVAAPAGTSYFEFDTAAAWVAANEIGVYTINPQTVS